MKQRVAAVVVCLFAWGGLLAQSTAGERALRDANDAVIGLLRDAGRTAPEAASDRGAFHAIRERKALMAEFIRREPSAALRLALPSAAASRLASAYPALAPDLEHVGQWEGTAEVTVFDGLDGSSETQVRLRTGGRTLRAYFASALPKGLACGATVRLRGVRLDEEMAAGEAQVLAASEDAACSTTGVQRAVILLVTFPGVTPPQSVTPAAMSDAFFGTATGRSVDGYWREASYGLASATGLVKGWYTLSRQYACTENYAILAEAIAAAGSEVNFADFNRIFVVFPSGGCAWAGLSNVGCGSYSTAGGVVTASASWLTAGQVGTRDSAVKLAVHEGGHALGLHHSASRDFGSEPLGPPSTLGTWDEYGDRYSAMGYWNLGHYSVPQKVSLGWLEMGKNVATVESNGTFTIEPSALQPAGYKGLKVRRGTGLDAWLWVEFKQKLGLYESSLGSQAFSGALVHYEDPLSNGRSNLLDFTPSTDSWTDPALPAGASWIDPYSNLKLTVPSAFAAGLTLNVEYGPPPCVPALPEVSLAPFNPGVEQGTSVSYTVTVRNNDSPGCASSAFTFTSEPAGWPTEFQPASLLLAPGQAANTVMTKSVPMATVPGTYQVSATAIAGSRSATAVSGATVIAATPPLSLVLAPLQRVYSGRTRITFVATAGSGTAPAAGAAVQFSLRRPDGTVVTQTGIAGPGGTVSWIYRLATAGSYSVGARAAFENQTASTGPIVFSVN